MGVEVGGEESEEGESGEYCDVVEVDVLVTNCIFVMGGESFRLRFRRVFDISRG